VNPAAPPAVPEAPAPSGRGLRAAMPVAVRAGLVAFAIVALTAQIVPVMIEVFGGGVAASTALKLGWLYELAFHSVGIDMTGTGGVTGRMSIAFLTGTGLALWVLYRAGRAAADRAGARVLERFLAGAAVGPVYAVPIVVVTTLVDLRLHTGGGFVPETILFQGVAWEAFVLPALLGIVAGGAGGIVGSLSRGSRAHAWLVGGWRAMLAALGLAVVGVMVLAAARPEGSAAYAQAVSSNGPRVALLLLGHHALVLPDQSFMVLAPSMGGCTELVGSRATIRLICPGRLPASGSTAVLDDLAFVGGARSVSGRPAPGRPMPAGYWAFVLVPALATLAAGRYAGAGTRGHVGWRGAVMRGAGAGVVFAILVGTGTWLASVTLWVRAADGSTTTSFVLGPRPLPTAALALAWGVVGGALGASFRRQEEGTPEPAAPVEPDAPVPQQIALAGVRVLHDVVVGGIRRRGGRPVRCLRYGDVVRLEGREPGPCLSPAIVGAGVPLGGCGRALPVPDAEIIGAEAQDVAVAGMRVLDRHLGCGSGRRRDRCGGGGCGGRIGDHTRDRFGRSGGRCARGRHDGRRDRQVAVAVAALDGLVLDVLGAIGALLHASLLPVAQGYPRLGRRNDGARSPPATGLLSRLNGIRR
jgi:hypothetical protein